MGGLLTAPPGCFKRSLRADFGVGWAAKARLARRIPGAHLVGMKTRVFILLALAVIVSALAVFFWREYASYKETLALEAQLRQLDAEKAELEKLREKREVVLDWLAKDKARIEAKLRLQKAMQSGQAPSASEFEIRASSPAYNGPTDPDSLWHGQMREAKLILKGD